MADNIVSPNADYLTEFEKKNSNVEDQVERIKKKQHLDSRRTAEIIDNDDKEIGSSLLQQSSIKSDDSELLKVDEKPINKSILKRWWKVIIILSLLCITFYLIFKPTDKPVDKPVDKPTDIPSDKPSDKQKLSNKRVSFMT